MKFQSPWMGRVKGSAGNMTGCKVYNKNVMRAKAFEVNNPNTAAQQVQRGYFAELTKLVAGFTPDQLRTLFPSKPKAMSRRNALAKQLAEYNMMDGTEKIVDFAEIDTLGNASTMDMGSTEIDIDENSITITLDTKVSSDASLESNYFCAAIVNDQTKEIVLPSIFAQVSIGTLSIATPDNWEDYGSIHAIPLITDSKTAPTSFGSFIIKVRPEKKSN